MDEELLLKKKESKKRINLMPIIIVIIILIIAGAILMIFKNKDSEEDEFANFPNAGIYENNNNYIWIYQNDSEYVYFISSKDNESKDYYGKLELRGNTATGVASGKEYSITFNENKLSFTSNNQEIPNGEYANKKKMKLYDYFKLGYGDLDFFESKYNGIFKNENNEVIEMYQAMESQEKVFLLLNDVRIVNDFEIMEENKFSMQTSKYIYNMELFGDKLILKKTNLETNQEIESIFVKSEKMTIEEAISNDLLYFY